MLVFTALFMGSAFAESSTDYNLVLFPLNSSTMSSGSYSLTVSPEDVGGKTTSSDYNLYLGVAGYLSDQNVMIKIVTPTAGETVTSTPLTITYALVHASDINFIKQFWVTSGGLGGTYTNNGLNLTAPGYSVSNGSYSFCIKATKKTDVNTTPVCVSVTVNIPAPAPPVCGNGSCEAGEDVSSCAADCAAGPGPGGLGGSGSTSCGDGSCNGTETKDTCPSDCKCGNGICEGTETTLTCLTDCPKTLVYEKQIYEKLLHSTDLPESKITTILTELGLAYGKTIALAKKSNQYIPVDKNIASFEKKYSDNTFEYYSIISTRVNNTFTKAVNSILVMDILPKTAAANASDVKQVSVEKTVLVSDPVIEFIIDNLAQQSETAFTYLLDAALDDAKTTSWDPSFAFAANGLPDESCTKTCGADETLDPVACVCNVNPYCGDGSCNGTETSATCSSDCPKTWEPPAAPQDGGTENDGTGGIGGMGGTGGSGGTGGNGGSTHSICVNYACVSVPGPGKSECSLNNGCNFSVNYFENLWINATQTVKVTSKTDGSIEGIKVIVQGMIDSYLDKEGTVNFTVTKAGKFNIDLYNNNGVKIVSLPFTVEDMVIETPAIALPKQPLNIKVKDSKGNLIQEVIIELLDEQGKVLKKAKTNGILKFTPLKEGFLKVKVYKSNGSNEAKFEVGGLLNNTLATITSSLSYLFGSESKDYPWTTIVIFILVCIAFLVSFDMFSIYFPLKGVSTTEFRKHLGIRTGIGLVFFITPIICSRILSISLGFISAVLEIVVIILLFFLLREQAKQKKQFQFIK